MNNTFCKNCHRIPNQCCCVNSLNTMTDRALIVFLMDEIDKASQWLVEGQTHMATGVLGGCHAEIRKHLSK